MADKKYLDQIKIDLRIGYKVYVNHHQWLQMHPITGLIVLTVKNPIHDTEIEHIVSFNELVSYADVAANFMKSQVPDDKSIQRWLCE